MKYADIKRAVLSHINQYTMAGAQAVSYTHLTLPTSSQV